MHHEGVRQTWQDMNTMAMVWVNKVMRISIVMGFKPTLFSAEAEKIKSSMQSDQVIRRGGGLGQLCKDRSGCYGWSLSWLRQHSPPTVDISPGYHPLLEPPQPCRPTHHPIWQSGTGNLAIRRGRIGTTVRGQNWVLVRLI